MQWGIFTLTFAHSGPSDRLLLIQNCDSQSVRYALYAMYVILFAHKADLSGITHLTLPAFSLAKPSVWR